MTPRDRAVLAGIVVIGAALRLVGIAQDSLWFDEVYTWWVTRRDLGDLLTFSLTRDVHPPLYLVGVWGWTRLAGDTEAALRLPSALASIATIPAMFALGRRLYDVRTGLLVAGLTAISWAPMHYGREARSYALLLLAVLLAVLGGIGMHRARQREESPGLADRLLAFGGGFVAAYTHHFGLLLTLVLGGLGVFTMPRVPGAKRGWLRGYAGLVVGCAPAVALAAWQRSAHDTFWIPPTDPGAFGWQFAGFLFWLEPAWRWVLALPVIGIGLAARRSGPRTRLSREDGFIGAWLLVPTTVALFVSVASLPVLTPRNLIVVLPAAYLVVARGLMQWPARARPWVVGAFAVAVLHTLLIGRAYHTTPQKPALRVIAATIAAEEAAGTSVPVVSSYIMPYAFDHALQSEGATARGVGRAARVGDVRGLVDRATVEGWTGAWVLGAEDGTPAAVRRALADAGWQEERVITAYQAEGRRYAIPR